MLCGANIEVGRGVLAALEGPNGAGKTTMLRIFATLVSPQSGRATVDGFDVTRSGARVRERIGVAFVNERSLYWRLSGRENLMVFARMRGLGKRAAAREVDELLEELDLTRFAASWVSDLSAGQRQRLVVARASLGEPSCMLVDEPLRGLDEAATAMVVTLLASRARAGAAVLVATPKLEELQGYADVCYRLWDGSVEPWPVGEEPTGDVREREQMEMLAQ